MYFYKNQQHQLEFKKYITRNILLNFQFFGGLAGLTLIIFAPRNKLFNIIKTTIEM